MVCNLSSCGEGNRCLYLFVALMILCIIITVNNAQEDVRSTTSQEFTSTMSKEEKTRLREKSLEMFDHAYGAYMEHAYPADELMPLSCKGRFRGSEPSRGDVDDTLGNFTLTLIDTLDTLAVLGKVDEFDSAVKNVIRDTRFDTDVVVSVFETNIRILGGLLGGHVAAVYFKRRKLAMLWYHDELLTMAKEVGDRLLPAFNTTTGIPYARVNLRHGITPKIINSNRDTCTSCAGTMILEFAALSRLTGIAVYEEKSRKAMDYLWGQRHRSNNLMGTVLNVHNGDWIRRESGVGAGIDSYYEYVLKAYVLLGDDTYLARFNKHYDGVMRYISQGPLLVDVHMHKPTSAARNFMDALLAFWPGLQVLVGDIGPAVETHEMLYQVVKRHNFLPEAFTTDFRIHWGQHPLRPEFVESTYFLYKATGDPYYLWVGKKVLENLEEHARVTCGFAAIKDIKRGTHEDQMDSFVLAETFKYLYLLFSDKSELALDVEDFVFTTEAHLLPLTLSVGNYSWSSPVPPTKKVVRPDIYRFDKMSVAEMAKAAEEESIPSEDEDQYSDAGGGVCRNYHVSVSEGPGYPHRLRYRMRDMVDRAHPPTSLNQQSGANLPRLRASEFVAANREHLDMLRQMGIRIATMPDGRIQLLHTAGEALSQAHAEAGLLFMQEMIELSKQSASAGEAANQHEPMYVRLLSEPYLSRKVVYRAGPAQFGYNLLTNPPVAGEMAIATPLRACTVLNNAVAVRGKIVLVERGDCMFVEKARNLQQAGAIAGVVIDQVHGSSSENLSLFAMSGDGTDDVSIPMVFLFWQHGQDLLGMIAEHLGLSVELTSSNGQEDEKDSCQNVPSADTSAPVPTPTQSSSSSSSSPSTTTSPPSSNSNTDSVGEPKGPGIVQTTSYWPHDNPPTPPSSSISSGDHPGYALYGFYHQDFHDLSTGQYFLQAGTRMVHLNIEVSPRQERDSDEDSRRLKFEPLPDGSKMITFFLRHFVRRDSTGTDDSSSGDDNHDSQIGERNSDGSATATESQQNIRLEKPNLNEMYLDVIHALQHSTNLESLEYASDYMKAIARFMEAAFFSLDRVDRSALDVMDRLAKEVRAKHFFPDGEVVYLQESSHIESEGGKNAHQDSLPETANTVNIENNSGTSPEIPLPQIPVTDVKSPETGTVAPKSISSTEENHIEQNFGSPSVEASAGSGGDIVVTPEENSLLNKNLDSNLDADNIPPRSRDIPESTPSSESGISSSSAPSSETSSSSVPHRSDDTISDGEETLDSKANDPRDVSSSPSLPSPSSSPTSSSSPSASSSTSTSPSSSSSSSSSPQQSATQKAANADGVRAKDEF